MMLQVGGIVIFSFFFFFLTHDPQDTCHSLAALLSMLRSSGAHRSLEDNVNRQGHFWWSMLPGGRDNVVEPLVATIHIEKEGCESKTCTISGPCVCAPVRSKVTRTRPRVMMEFAEYFLVSGTKKTSSTFGSNGPMSPFIDLSDDATKNPTTPEDRTAAFRRETATHLAGSIPPAFRNVNNWGQPQPAWGGGQGWGGGFPFGNALPARKETIWAE